MTSSDRLKYKRFLLAVLAVISLAIIASITYCTSRGQSHIDRGISIVERAYSDFSTGVKTLFTPKDGSGGVYIVNGSINDEWMAVTASREILVKYRYAATWGGSTKSIDLVATYRVQAGLNLNQVKYEFQTDRAIVHHAGGTIVSCERVKLLDLDEDHGFWNYLGDEDRQSAQNALDEEAYRIAAQDDILRVAEKNFIEKLQNEQQAEGMNYEFVAAE